MKYKILFVSALGAVAFTLAATAKEEMKAAAPVATVSSEELESTSNDDILARISALEASSKKSDWSQDIQIRGDIRARYEHVEVEGDTSKGRFRGRARVGVYSDVNDQVYAGVRIATGSDESPTSTNQSLGEFSNKRAIWLDLMYMGYTPEQIENLELVLGKIKQPWIQVSELMYDSDVNPEGLNTTYSTKGDGTEFIFNLGYYVWKDAAGDNPASDVTMGAAQVATTLELSDKMDLTAGANAFIYHNAGGTEIPVDEDGDPIIKGNTTDGADNWLYDYELLEGFAKLDLKGETLPVKIYGDYIVNMASGVEEDTAWLFGIGTSYKKAGFDYNYRDIDADAVIDLLADSDFSGGGTGGKGHKFKLKYKLLKNR